MFVEKLEEQYFKIIGEYDVGGLFVSTELILRLIDCIYSRLGIIIPIRSIYGAENVLWNGGRYTVKPRKTNWKEELQLINEYGIKPLFTFTSSSITKEQLYDVKCNEMLEYVCCNDIPCEVRVTSELLKEYIEENYKQVIINASVIKVVMDEAKGDIEYYKGLEADYAKYVVHPDDNFNIELLKQLDVSKAEILLNERCVFNCRYRKRHYLSIEELMISGLEKKDIQNKILNSCPAVPEIKQNSSLNRNISLSLNEVDTLCKIGFRNFKIQGRVENTYSFFYDIIRYIIKDEYVVSQVYQPFCEIISKYLNS